MLAASASLLGFDPRRVLETDNPSELLVIRAVVDKAAQLREQLDRSLAVEIANAVGKLFR